MEGNSRGWRCGKSGLQPGRDRVCIALGQSPPSIPSNGYRSPPTGGSLTSSLWPPPSAFPASATVRPPAGGLTYTAALAHTPPPPLPKFTAWIARSAGHHHHHKTTKKPIAKKKIRYPPRAFVRHDWALPRSQTAPRGAAEVLASACQPGQQPRASLPATPIFSIKQRPIRASARPPDTIRPHGQREAVSLSARSK